MITAPSANASPNAIDMFFILTPLSFISE